MPAHQPLHLLRRRLLGAETTTRLRAMVMVVSGITGGVVVMVVSDITGGVVVMVGQVSPRGVIERTKLPRTLRWSCTAPCLCLL